LEILPKIYQEEVGSPTEIAKLAKIVDESATQGDKTSINILKKAGKELALSVTAVAKRMKMQKDVTVGGLGSVFNSKIVRTTFVEEIKRKLPSSSILEPLTGSRAIEGPIILAFKKIKVPITKEKMSDLLDKIDR